MAILSIRELKDSTHMYKVSFRPVDKPQFCMTFQTLEEAEYFIMDHEGFYIDNPAPYLEWRKYCDSAKSLADYLHRYHMKLATDDVYDGFKQRNI